MLRQTLNEVPLGVLAWVRSDATTQVDTSELYEEDNYDDVQRGPSGPPKTMYAEISSDYICSREDKALHKVISQPKSIQNLVDEANKT